MSWGALKRLGWLLLAILAGASAARADGLFSCVPTRSDVSAVRVDDLQMGIADTYAWATATVRILMRNQTTRTYYLVGRADPIAEDMHPNETAPGFSYPGFACTITYPAINSVRSCFQSGSRRFCKIGLFMFGRELVYAVTVNARIGSAKEASLP
jgi:hypothetical protein